MTIRINDSIEITGDEDYTFERNFVEGCLTREINRQGEAMRTLNDDIAWLYRLLARREKQLARVLLTARQDGDALRDVGKFMIGKHNLSTAGIIRMIYQIIYTWKGH